MNDAPPNRQVLLALASLFVGGGLLGISTSVAKYASDRDLPPLGFLAWSIFGATVLLLVQALVRKKPIPMSVRAAEYYVVSALIPVAGTNLIYFTAVAHVGAGFVALTITLPPLLTWLGALALKMERFSAFRVAGVVAALTGAGVLSIAQLGGANASAFWVFLTLLGPIFLAIGNLYRTLRWPPGADAEALAPGMLIAATVILFSVGALPVFTLALPLTGATLALVTFQAAVFAGQFLLLFILQKTGGPVLLSLLGSVGAVVGVPVAVFLLGEAPPGGLFWGAGLIGMGVALVVVGQAGARTTRL